MAKLVSSVLLSMMVLAAAGCEMNRPPVPSAEHALNTYHARLAESCPSKHLDQLPQDEIHTLAVKNYIAADTQAQQLIDLRANAECKAHDDHPSCYDTGFIEALNTTGGLPEFVKTVCGLPVTCANGQCSTATKQEAAATPAAAPKAE